MGTKVFITTAGVAVIILIIGGVIVLGRGAAAPSSTATVSPSATPALASSIKCPIAPGATTTELQKTDTTVGTGAEATASSTVSVRYTGCLSDGRVFDSTQLRNNEPASFPLSGVIKGWQEGIPGMKVGGVRTLVIPASLAYGDQDQRDSDGSISIPGGSTLTFQVELVSVQ